MRKFIIVLLTVIGISTKVSAQQPAIIISDKTGWHKIAETKVDHKADKDEVLVMLADRFATLVVKVTEAPVDLNSVDIYFEDGTSKTANINKSFKTPGQSDYIQLGGEKEIKRIVFMYKTMANAEDKKGHVEIWGIKENPDKKDSKSMK
ncbi:MAG TPA: hypothetical protein VGC65_06020 [Bacteroidia bacterium]|jgi:hypothetical protein